MTYWFSIIAIRFNGAGMEIANWPQKIKADNIEDAYRKAMELALEKCPVKEYWGCHKVDGVMV